ncbi:hypothetical protein J6590_027154 [Homalodisca vitripennis]|nr:hypothetical protein J6590_027154 [Homalodisca vitripennis]
MRKNNSFSGDLVSCKSCCPRSSTSSADLLAIQGIGGSGRLASGVCETRSPISPGQGAGCRVPCRRFRWIRRISGASGVDDTRLHGWPRMPNRSAGTILCGNVEFRVQTARRTIESRTTSFPPVVLFFLRLLHLNEPYELQTMD